MDRSVKHVGTYAERRQCYAVAGEVFDLEVESHGTLADKPLVVQYPPPS